MSRHGGAVVFCCAEPLDQLLRRSDAAAVQQERDHSAVSRQEFQRSDTVQESFSRRRHVLVGPDARKIF